MVVATIIMTPNFLIRNAAYFSGIAHNVGDTVSPNYEEKTKKMSTPETVDSVDTAPEQSGHQQTASQIEPTNLGITNKGTTMKQQQRKKIKSQPELNQLGETTNKQAKPSRRNGGGKAKGACMNKTITPEPTDSISIKDFKPTKTWGVQKLPSGKFASAVCILGDWQCETKHGTSEIAEFDTIEEALAKTEDAYTEIRYPSERQLYNLCVISFNNPKMSLGWGLALAKNLEKKYRETEDAYRSARVKAQD